LYFKRVKIIVYGNSKRSLKTPDVNVVREYFQSQYQFWSLVIRNRSSHVLVISDSTEIMNPSILTVKKTQGHLIILIIKTFPLIKTIQH